MNTSKMDQLIRQAASRGRILFSQGKNNTQTVANPTPPPGNAGAGTGPDIPGGQKVDMNYILRAAYLRRNRT